MCDESGGEALTRQPSADKHADFLTECMKENLNHARHVENERLLFLTLFTALTGVLLVWVLQQDSDVILSGLVISILLALNWLCKSLIRRWNGVFHTHMQMAETIYRQVITQWEQETADALPKYYCFNYQAHQGKPSKYVKTNLMFLIFNIAMFVILLAALFYCLFLR